MAINKLSDIMSTQIKAPDRSNFDRGSINRMWFSPGYIYPIGVLEVIPNSNVKLDLDAIIKANNTIGSLYGTFRISVQAFFVPSRLYCKELDQNHRLGLSNEDLDNVMFPVIAQGDLNGMDSFIDINPALRQQIDNTDQEFSGYTDYSYFGFNPAGSILDNLRMLPPNFDLRKTMFSDEGVTIDKVAPGINAIPFIGYYDIWRNYYQNMQEQYVDMVLYETNDTTYLQQTTSVGDINFDELIPQIYNRQTDHFVDMENTSGWNILSNKAWRQMVNRNFSSTETPDKYTVHSGYMRRTFDDDYFVSRLIPNYVDQLDTTSTVTISNNMFNVQQLRLAQRNWRYTNKSTLANAQRYDDLLEVHYGAKLNRELNIPHFLGSVSSDFYFEDIYAQTSGAELGQRNGILNASMRGKNLIDVNIEEHGYIMVLFCCIPRVDYVGATPKMYFKDTFADVYKPEYDAVGYQDIMMQEIIGPDASYNDWVIGQQPAWFEYMTDFNHCHGRFALDERKFNTLTRSWIDRYTDYENTEIYTYTQPWAFNYIFEETANWQDNFSGQFNVKFRVYQPMSKQIVSML